MFWGKNVLRSSRTSSGRGDRVRLLTDRWLNYNNPVRRGARAVEWDGLENRCGGNSTQGSNPCLSAIHLVNIAVLSLRIPPLVGRLCHSGLSGIFHCFRKDSRRASLAGMTRKNCTQMIGALRPMQSAFSGSNPLPFCKVLPRTRETGPGGGVSFSVR